MSRSKLERFKLNAIRTNVIEPGKEIYDNIKGQWRRYFNNDHPLVLELGCGRGEYTTEMAVMFPAVNFIGIDIKGGRIWKGSTVAVEKGLQNAAFLRTKIQNLDLFFKKGEADEIWITFPDPRPKENEEKLRLTNGRYLALYKQILNDGGTVHLKTDNLEFFKYSIEEIRKLMPAAVSLQASQDLYSNELVNEKLRIQTTFEKKYLALGLPICYLNFQFNARA